MFRKNLDILLIATPIVLGIVFAFVDPFPAGKVTEGSAQVSIP